MTNATKAVIITAANTFLGSVMALLVAFNVPLSDAQQAAISGLAVATLNLAALVYVMATYQNSARRIPDFPEDGFADLREPVA